MLYLQPFSLLILINAGILGLMIGSFLNVCIYRLPKEHISIVTPRSHCPHCGKLIQWFDNIPVISWLLLGACCRHCRHSISIRYTLVELLCGLLFVVYTHQVLLQPLGYTELFGHSISRSVFFSMSEAQRWWALAIALYFVCVMVTLTFIDIDYLIIPDVLTYPGIILAPIISGAFPHLHSSSSVIANPHLAGFLSGCLGTLVGGGSLYFVSVVGKVIFRKEAMGFGDVKLMAMVGGFLGWDAALLIFALACLLGSCFGIVSLLLTKNHYIPFGPYLAAATLATFLYKNQLLSIAFDVWPMVLSNWLDYGVY